MDLSAELKENLISRIKNSNDITLLNKLKTVFDSSEQALYQLNAEQENAINSGREQIKREEFSANAKVITDLREWLSKK
ncbi:hypothetical protein [Flavobacterium sp.]|uniref:hypothetical protein n=1 Tax=Flavobacterium sp. TaxID=239 RepID=UPI00261A354A|nr:hypothetical protein [Flavobacterium sp.]